MILKFQFIVFYTLLLFLPVNLGRHFYFDFSSVNGIYIDYLIPTLYLTDLLIGLLLLFWLIDAISRPLRFRKVKPTILIVLISFLTVVIASITIAENQPAAFYKGVKLLEFLLFTLWLTTHIELKRDFKNMAAVISLGVLGESLLALAQWFRNGSIFGYAFFGEQPYSMLTPGIAKTAGLGELHTRPYGTFPHPNVLGGYLSISLIWLLVSWFGGSDGTGLAKRPWMFNGWRLLTVGFGLLALFLTFSRTAWVALGLGLTLLLIKKLTLATIFRRILIGTFIIIGLSWAAFQFFPNINDQPAERNLETMDLSITRRRELNSFAFEMIRDHKVFGVGLNNFTVALDGYGRVSGLTRFLQPVHNIFLLVGAETGLFGLLAFLGLCLIALKKSISASGLLILTLIQLFWLGLFDHYLLTLQPGLLLFCLSLGLAFSRQKN